MTKYNQRTPKFDGHNERERERNFIESKKITPQAA